MAYSFKGNICFGFVYIPITLHLAIKDSTPNFRLFDAKTKSKIQYKKTCEECNGKEVKNEDIVKGYEYESGQFVFLTDDEFKKITQPKDHNINIEQFINLSEVDPIWFEKTYYVVPKEADKAYYLLLEVLKSEKKAGLGKTIFTNKECLVLIRPKNDMLILSTLYFKEEIKDFPVIKEKSKISSDELKMAKMIVKEMSKPFKPENYHDEYRKRIKEIIAKKIKGNKIVTPHKKSKKHVEDLMEALKNSLETISDSKSSHKKYNQTA